MTAHKAQAQTQDTLGISKDSMSVSGDSIQKSKALKKKIYAGPRKATILSAVLPGLGQAYNSIGEPRHNQKYWKIPIIYAGLGGFGYMFVVNNKEYNYYRKNLIAEYDDNASTINSSGYSGEQLKILKVQYRKYRDIAIIGMGLVYIFNIIDANVDGHLKTFDVSDDLSIHIDPWQNSYRLGTGYRTATGLSLKINFK